MSKEQKDYQATPDTSGIDVVDGMPAASETGEIPVAETAVMDPVEEPVEETEPDDPPVKRPVGFWTRKRIGIAGGVAAALVVGAVGIGFAMAPDTAADPAPEPTKAEQKAGAEKKTPTAATGAKAADPAAAQTPQAAETPAADPAAQADPAAAAPEAQQGAAGQGSDAAGGATKPSATAPSGGGSSSASGGSGSSGGSNAGSGSSGGSDKPAATAPKKEEHKHSWEPVYKKKWVENWVTVTDEAAWDEPIYAKVDVCNKCGTQFESSSEAAAHREEYALKGEGGHSSYGKKVQVGTKHHDAVTHQEDQGYYEKVKTGEKCSGCGQTR